MSKSNRRAQTPKRQQARYTAVADGRVFTTKSRQQAHKATTFATSVRLPNLFRVSA